MRNIGLFMFMELMSIALLTPISLVHQGEEKNAFRLISNQNLVVFSTAHSVKGFHGDVKINFKYDNPILVQSMLLNTLR